MYHTSETLLECALSVVCELDGTNGSSFFEFFDSCDEALEILGSEVEAILVKLIRTKFKGTAHYREFFCNYKCF